MRLEKSSFAFEKVNFYNSYNLYFLSLIFFIFISHAMTCISLFICYVWIYCTIFGIVLINHSFAIKTGFYLTLLNVNYILVAEKSVNKSAIKSVYKKAQYFCVYNTLRWMTLAKIATTSEKRKKSYIVLYYKFIILKEKTLSFALRNRCFSKALLSPLNPSLTSCIAAVIIKILFRDKKKERKMER